MKKFKGKQSGINTCENMDNSSESGGSKWIKITGALALIAALMGMGKIVNGQTLVNKKEYENILDTAKKSQEAIGEDLATFLFNGTLQRWLQLEIEKQSKKHQGDFAKGKEFSVFKEDDIEPDPEEKILSAKEMEDILMRQIDSILTKDMGRFYNAFHEYQKGGTNLVGKDKGKGNYMKAGWNYAEFPVDLNVDIFMKYQDLPYSKKELDELKKEFERIYEIELSKWKTESEKARKSNNVADYETKSLILLDQAKERILKKIYITYIKPFVDKYIKQYHSTDKDAK